MLHMAFANVPQDTICNAAKPAARDVVRGQRAIGFALTVLGRLVDFLGSSVLRYCNRLLERDILTLRGLRSTLNEIDSSLVLDPDLEGTQGLEGLEADVRKLRAEALRAKRDKHLRKIHDEVCRTAELCTVMNDIIVELKRAIADHDAKALAASDDMKRVLADLQRTDDVPAGRYSELADMLRRIPESPAEDRSRDPAPL